MLLGKFLPPHLGHVYLAEFARAYCTELTVVVGSLAREPIPGALRHAWMSELASGARVVHMTDEVPQEPSEHPDFWQIWHDCLMKHLGSYPEVVFASETYGKRLAEVLHARFVPVDLARSAVPVSGTAIREDPMTHWAYIPRCVRPYFARRVCVFGPECTGKSTLARRLAAHYGTAVVPEYARAHLAAQDGALGPTDIPLIARGQMASEDALARNAERVLICDTDVRTTVLWSEALFGQCPDWIRTEAARRRYDLYLLTDIDVPWVQDGVRYLPGERASFMARCERALGEQGAPVVRVRGSAAERFAIARDAVDALVHGASAART
jgi:NadR type nicotinamide-nucleotide adenylyltransferase